VAEALLALPRVGQTFLGFRSRASGPAGSNNN
jgi:hypothetical protein